MGLKGSVVLIAPTGSGKTEAALLWACSQAQSGQAVPRLFYCLPFQASMNAIYDRLKQFSFPDVVGLEHSRSALAQYKRAIDDNVERENATKRAKWEKTLARLHYYPVRVLSPYQLLKAPYRLKGYEMLLTDCFKAVFILDEIHAYEPARLAQIIGLVKYLQENYQARFFIMSATLPAVVTEKLAQALGEYTAIEADSVLFEEFQRHRLFLRQGDLVNEIANEAIQLAIAGKRVLLCCNTIKRAQTLYQQIISGCGNDVEVVLLHGQFNTLDRLRKEQRIQEVVGAKSRISQPLIVIATQVIEVSLDIDMDVLFSDPAPLEALVQRFGRINRRKKHEWAPVYVFSDCDDAIYDEEVVRRSLQVLANFDGAMIQENKIRQYLADIYQDSVAEQWNKKYQDAYRMFNRSCLSTLTAFNASDKLEELFYQAFDSIQVLPLSLEQNYRQLMQEQDPLAASQLLVSIPWGKYRRLRAQGLIRESQGIHIVTVPYTENAGLEI